VESTIRRGALREERSTERDIIGTVNDLLGQVNLELVREGTATTDGAGTWTTVVTLPDMPDDCAWRIRVEAVGFGSGRRSYHEVAALWYRAGAGATQEGADQAVFTAIESHVGIDVRTQASTNAVSVQVRDDNAGEAMTFHVKVTAKERK